ncbi:uncharacterized protein LOC129657824 isoform X3 [Bubalus kerabau]|uniref:uncharacterized protein LOC129657824 isoform X3 n=1 Tax=Bubalus carabanensis TaxID=3119969 RepID=UPI00244E7BD9|nr:uncharacterized protein LOC129657824 isoform X3 [Bubalus carabanensis]
MVLSESWGCWRGSGCSNREWVRVPPPPPTPGCSGWLVGLLRWYLSTALRSYPQFDGATQLDSWTSAKDLSSMGLTVLWEGMLKSRSQLTRYCRFYHQDQGQKSWGKKVPKDIHPLWPLLVPFNQHKSECISSLWQPSAFTESPSGARNPPCLLIMAGLLRSDRGSLSVSSPSGERKDACGLQLSQSGMEPTSPAVEVQSLNHQEAPCFSFYLVYAVFIDWTPLIHKEGHGTIPWRTPEPDLEPLDTSPKNLSVSRRKEECKITSALSTGLFPP